MSSILDTGSQNCTHTLKNSSRACEIPEEVGISDQGKKDFTTKIAVRNVYM